MLTITAAAADYARFGRTGARIPCGGHPAPRGITLVEYTWTSYKTPAEAGEGAGPPNVGSGPTDPSERAEATLNVRMLRPKEASAGLGSAPRPNVNGPWA